MIPLNLISVTQPIVGNSTAAPEASFVLFGVGVTFALLMLCASLCSVLAIKRALPADRWFALGLLGNLFAVLYLLNRPSLESLPQGYNRLLASKNSEQCSNCKKDDHPRAADCPVCNQGLRSTTYPGKHGA